MIGVLIFIFILAILILSHEGGHFFAARWFNIKVEEFGFGFPPRLWAKQKGETTFSFNLLPLGGFVKIYGEGGEGQDDPRSFVNKPIWQRAIVLSAGVIANFLVGFVALVLLFSLGMPVVITAGNQQFIKERELRITEVFKNSPAFFAGLKIGDKIIKVSSDKKILENLTIREFQSFILENLSKKLTIVIERREAKTKQPASFSIIIEPRLIVPEGEGPLGIGLLETGIAVFPWYLSLKEAAKTVIYGTGNIILAIFQNLKAVIFKTEAPMVTGPIGIAIMSSKVYHLGWSYLGNFLAILSLNLAVINFLPFPALDGGRFLFLMAEKLRGRTLSKEIEVLVNNIGFAFLLFLIFLITIKDILRFF